MPSEYDALLESQSAQPKSEYDALLEQPQNPQQGGAVSGVIAGIGRALNPVSLIKGVLDIGGESDISKIKRYSMSLKDIVSGTPVEQALQNNVPEVAQERAAVFGRLGTREQAAALTGIGLQAGMLALPFIKPLRLKLRDIAFGKQEGLAAETAAETEVIKNASQKPSAERIPSAQVRPGVDEEAPLRQQGQVAEVRQKAQEKPVAPVPQPEQPVSEAGQAPAVSGQPKIISTAVQTPEGIKTGETWNEPHDSIAARVATERPFPTQETGITPPENLSYKEGVTFNGRKFRRENGFWIGEGDPNFMGGSEVRVHDPKTADQISAAYSAKVQPSGVAAALKEEQKGFLIREPDGTERFTNDRTEAAGIAKAAGQVKPENSDTTELHSQQLAEPVSTEVEAPTVATQPKEVPPPETPEALGEALKERPRSAGIANRVLQERAAKGEIPQAPEAGEGHLTEDIINKSRQDYTPERALAASENIKNGSVSESDAGQVRIHEENLTRVARDAEKALDVDPKNPALQQAYNVARDNLSKWHNETVQPMKTQWSNTGKSMQGATDIDTGSYIGLQKLAWDTAKRDFTAKEEPVMRTAAKRVSKAVDDVRAAIAKAEDQVQKVLKPSKYMDLNQLRESLAEKLKNITC